jgi:hypothetical protein
MIKNAYWSSVKYFYSCQIWIKIFSDRFFTNTHISNFIKILPVGAELFHADGQTGVTRLIVDFRNFANPPKNDALVFKMLFKTSQFLFAFVQNCEKQLLASSCLSACPSVRME